MRILDCHPDAPNHAAHLDAILSLINHAIVHTTTIYDYTPRTGAQIAKWFEAKQRGGYPVLGLLNDDDRLVGFATFGPFRD